MVSAHFIKHLLGLKNIVNDVQYLKTMVNYLQVPVMKLLATFCLHFSFIPLLIEVFHKNK